MSANTRTAKSSIPKWGAELFENMTQSNTASTDRILAKIEELKTVLQSDIDTIRKTAEDTNVLASQNKLEIEDLKTAVLDLKRTCNGLKIQNEQLQKQCDSQESYGRRENLVIRGIGEQKDEQCVNLVKRCFINDLKMDANEVNSMVISRCHRLGVRNGDTGNGNAFSRPIIVRFLNYNDRKSVWNSRFNIVNKRLSINENFASNTEYGRRLLYPVLRKAKQSDVYTKAHMKGDTLVLESNVSKDEYSLDKNNIDDLPDAIHPRQFGFKTNADCLIFGGPHSIFYYMSNFYTYPMQYKDIRHNSLEHAFQYAKAIHFRDDTSAQNILSAKTPSDAKQYGRSVKNFNTADWNGIKEGILCGLLRIKFEKNSEMANKLIETNGMCLAEAGMNKSYAIGLPLNHKSVFDKKKWSRNGNLLGRSLMKIREELMAE